jgi:hypothetical protein
MNDDQINNLAFWIVTIMQAEPSDYVVDAFNDQTSVKIDATFDMTDIVKRAVKAMREG